MSNCLNGPSATPNEPRRDDVAPASAKAGIPLSCTSGPKKVCEGLL